MSNLLRNVTSESIIKAIDKTINNAHVSEILFFKLYTTFNEIPLLLLDTFSFPLPPSLPSTRDSRELKVVAYNTTVYLAPKSFNGMYSFNNSQKAFLMNLGYHSPIFGEKQVNPAHFSKDGFIPAKATYTFDIPFAVINYAIRSTFDITSSGEVHPDSKERLKSLLSKQLQLSESIAIRDYYQYNSLFEFPNQRSSKHDYSLKLMDQVTLYFYPSKEMLEEVIVKYPQSIARGEAVPISKPYYDRHKSGLMARVLRAYDGFMDHKSPRC